ncbi:GcrA family cell cycle regulator [Acetobacteraceae bacterium KSS8]|uniref:GcrA family cell cycle regulator n=1 Tax=Endosaccharibacter trunci TaxID=2812733 RepID=A0ABT1WAI0_9PROT|nr:GcrA family cell cycle regulator [Acetobacteraceae bacterium KSS8]
MSAATVLRRSTFNWTDDRDATLRREWEAGTASGEIARRLGTSKNSVIGRVHRLKLASRGSPIGRSGPIKVKPAREPKKQKPDPWSLPEIAALDAGEDAIQSISAKWGRPIDEIRAKMIELGVIIEVAPEPAPVVQQAPKPALVDKAPVQAPVVSTIFIPRSVAFEPGQGCQFPTSTGRRHRFECSEPRIDGRPYCATHAAACYQKTGANPDARVEAAAWHRRPSGAAETLSP